MFHLLDHTATDGRPQKVSFTFDNELEHESLRWVVYEDTRYLPFEVPALGGRAVIDAAEFNLMAPPTSESGVDAR